MSAQATATDRGTGLPWHLLSLREVSTSEWEGLLRDAETLAGPRGREPLLAGRRFGMIFLNPSLRTRTSFEVACGDLGSYAVYLQPGTGLWQLEYREHVPMTGEAAEHVHEAIGVLGRMLDGLGVRSFPLMRDAAEDAADPMLGAVAGASPVPVLNLESAMDHPHQGLADALTVRRHFAGEKVRIAIRWAPHIKSLPLAVPHAALLAFAREGHDVVLCHPEECGLDEVVMASARTLSEKAGGSLEISHDKSGGLDGARVVYAKSWGPRGLYGDEAGMADYLGSRRDWIVDTAAMKRTNDGRFMHCLPVRRGLVVEDAVIDGKQSLVVDQAAARVEVQKATLCRAMGIQP